MAAMALDPSSRGVVDIPKNVYPYLCDACPEEYPTAAPRTGVIKCRNVPFGSTFQISGADNTAAKWVSPSTLSFTWQPGSAGFSEAQVITPDGLASNKIRLTAY